MDLDAGTLRVRRTLTTGLDSRYLVGETAKTKAGHRVVALDPETVAALRWQRADQRLRKVAARPVWQETGLVLDHGDGRFLTPPAATARLRRLCRAAGVPPVSPHGIRHTVITLTVLSGVPLPVVQRRVGHANITITSDVYVTVDAPSDRAASAALADLLRASQTPRTAPDPADETDGNDPAVTAGVTTAARNWPV